jgi:predicted dehydrogenase
MTTQESHPRSFRVGFVGAGGIAPEHADALRLLDGVNIVSVCDLQEQRAKSLAEQYSIPRTYASLSEMLERENLDAVHVLTPPQYHVAPALECLRAGVNVYIEKPLGLSTSDCKLVVAEAAARGLVAAVNHQLSRHHLIDEIVQAAKDRRFGRIVHVSVNFCVGSYSIPTKEVNHFMFSTPQSLLFEFCPHPFSVIRRLLGKPIAVSALASAGARLENGKPYYRSWEIGAIADRGSAHLFFSVWQGNPEVTLWVYGQDATAFADLNRGTLQFHENSPYPLTARMRDGVRNAGRLFRQSTARYLDEHLVKLKLKPEISMNAFCRPMSAFYSALRTGQPVAEDASAGHDVVAYCEMAAAAMQIQG